MGDECLTTITGDIWSFDFPTTPRATPVMEGCTFYPATRTVYLPPDATHQDFRGELLQHRVYLPLVVRNP